MSDTVNFAASGELDNGWTVNYTMGLDGSATAAGAAFEDRTLAIGLGDMGTVTTDGSRWFICCWFYGRQTTNCL